jgi:hypothetical protein
MREELLLAKKIHTDDTPIPVLTNECAQTARLWVYLTDESHSHKICIYDYSPTRQKKWPKQFLEHFQGFLQADAYNGYDDLYKGKKIIEVGCMAHARRKFYELTQKAKGPSHASDIVDLIGKLYAVEKHIQPFSPIQRHYYRNKYCKPILKRLKRKISVCYKKSVPRSPFFEALQYAWNHWRALTRYLSDGILDIDNNKAERAIRPLAIGRKNWLFAGSHNGGKRSAVIYSIIETCKMQDINPFEYLTDVLARIPNTLQKDINQLLPYHWKKST